MPTSPVLTNEQRVASVVHLTLQRDTTPPLVVEPEIVNVFYTHDGGRGDEMKPHRIVWEAIGLLSGESIEIHLRDHDLKSKGVPVSEAQAQKLLKEVFTDARELKPAAPAKGWRFGWTLPTEGVPAVESRPLSRPTDDRDRINVKYDVVFRAPGRPPFVLDPGINLIPDP